MIKKHEFDDFAVTIFHHQAVNNPVYAQYIRLLGKEIKHIKSIKDIPFLPISLFKSHEVKTGDWLPQVIYTSSGTTGTINSQHYVKDESFYLSNAKNGFESFYGDIKQYLVIALLPSYLERTGSSLIAMMQDFIAQAQPGSGFYLNEYIHIITLIEHAKVQKTPILLLGVSFALLDFAEQYQVDLEGVIVMETGGMKGKRKELIREELHAILKQRFNITSVHAEYGMTELLSQAYSKGNGIFSPSPTLKVRSRPLNDPLGTEIIGKTGILNIIDLANIDSCCFIATDDLGVVFDDHTFSVSGRVDNSDIRGCNLMING